jgi:hypothetical protein
MKDLIYGLAVAGALILFPIFLSAILPSLAGRKPIPIFKADRKK